MTHQGSCHCGRIAFEVDAVIEKAMECNCSYCSRKGYLLDFVPRSRFRFRGAEPTMTAYRFNKHRIDHQFCPTCGCGPFAFGKGPDGADVVAVNVRCLEDVDLSKLERLPIDGRSL